ncbi:unnamed protein product [Schistosoma turkestanicum]|nr:unnamed protein product [Schistosoma turkestanicum]
MRSLLMCLMFLAFTTIVIVGSVYIRWDFYQFSLSWPPTYCDPYLCKLPPEVNSFTIHGVWPTIWPNITPKCNVSVKWNLSNLDPIRPELDYKWPRLKNNTKRDIFWRYEYRKHGRCALEDPAIIGVLGYFNAALSVYNHIDLLNKLQMYNITPSNVKLYNKTYFRDVLKKLYGIPGRLICKMKCENDRTDFDLEDIRFCLNRTFAFINCSTEGDCPEKFYFPPYPNRTTQIKTTKKRRKRNSPDQNTY